MENKILRERVDELATRVNGTVEEILGELVVTIKGGYALEALNLAKNFKDVPCDFLHDMWGTDHGTHMEVVYQLFSYDAPQRMRIKALIDREHPVIDSATSLWAGADFLEREAYDMFGIQFKGHPNLTRIYLWDNFEGFPMRKDYVTESAEVRAIMRVRTPGE